MQRGGRERRDSREGGSRDEGRGGEGGRTPLLRSCGTQSPPTDRAHSRGWTTQQIPVGNGACAQQCGGVPLCSLIARLYSSPPPTPPARPLVSGHVRHVRVPNEAARHPCSSVGRRGRVDRVLLPLRGVATADHADAVRKLSGLDRSRGALRLDQQEGAGVSWRRGEARSIGMRALPRGGGRWRGKGESGWAPTPRPPGGGQEGLR